ncbi:MAG: CHAP domain-containing protein [Chthoniobacter sp.]|nr:CHAP domain-containing protein [Chthoniobacter sp.]
MIVVLAIAAAHSITWAQEIAPLSQWMRRDGQIFEAKFLRLHGAAIVMVRDGVEFTVPISALTPASLEQARRLAMRVPLAPVVTRAVPLSPVASFAYGPSILEYCRESVGQKIGNGQCADLAARALKNAGAALRAGPDSPGEGDYVWGDLAAQVKVGFFGVRGVRELAHVQAGDIVQFHNTRFTGYDHTGAGIYRMEARHHTAVVESVDVPRATITILHQNWNNQEIVRRQTLSLGGMTNGWLRFYHPIPRPG